MRDHKCAIALCVFSPAQQLVLCGQAPHVFPLAFSDPNAGPREARMRQKNPLCRQQ